MNNPILKFYFQPPFSGWMPTSIYQQLYNYYYNLYSDKIIADNTSISYNSNYGHKSGPHHLIIENIYTKYYKVVTYWDSAFDVTNDYGGWDNSLCKGVYSCVNAKSHAGITATSYCVYNESIENYISNIDITFTKKNNKYLCFRGYLYGDRAVLNSCLQTRGSNIITIYSNTLSQEKYIKEINSYRIGLSLNGIAEICNRDIEILGVGSVLLRPRLQTTGFYDPFLPDIHYVSFDVSTDPKTQLNIIEDKYNMLKKDEDYMMHIAISGHDWYNRNGCRGGNVNILSQVLNIEELL